MSLLTFLDIECVPRESSYNNLDERAKELWDKFQERFVKESWYESKEQAYDRQAALYGEWGMIVCICAGYFVTGVEELTIKTYTNEDEAWLLSEFVEDFLKIKRGVKWCGHNIKKFDIPYIAQRMVANGMKITSYPFINRMGVKPWENNDIDTMDLWTQGVYGKYIDLDRLCMALGVESPKGGGVDGARVGDCYWGRGEYSEMKFEERMGLIAEYCPKDIQCLPPILEKFGILV